MTLLVLDLSVDYRGHSAGSLWRSLGQQQGRFIAFFIAFWVIARFWLVHHRVFRRVTRHDDSLCRAQPLVPVRHTVLPFTTRLLGQTNEKSVTGGVVLGQPAADQPRPHLGVERGRASPGGRTDLGRAPGADGPCPVRHGDDVVRPPGALAWLIRPRHRRAVVLAAVRGRPPWPVDCAPAPERGGAPSGRVGLTTASS